jgi:hypothetical protein
LNEIIRELKLPGNKNNIELKGSSITKLLNQIRSNNELIKDSSYSTKASELLKET